MNETTADASLQSPLEPLVSQLIDGTLTESQAASLNSLLEKDKDARRQYSQIMQVHGLLKWTSAAPAAVASMPGSEDSAKPQRVDTSHAATVAPRSLKAPRVLAALLPWFVVAACVAVLATAAIFSMNPTGNQQSTSLTDSTPQRAGKILQQWSPVWADSGSTMSTWSEIAVGQRLSLDSGRVACMFDVGAEVILQGPARVNVLGPSLLEVDEGNLTVRVSKEGRGFSVKTMVGKVIDLGTEFGVSVAGDGETEVVVFDGYVDFEPSSGSGSQEAVAPQDLHTRWRLEMGQAVRVASEGEMSRVTNVDSNRFPRSGLLYQQRPPGTSVIASITDNLHSQGVGHYYQICRGGLEEDAVAYVDRYYQWNGVDKNGIPEFLHGADYVLTFNDDKIVHDLVPEITCRVPANVYVFWDVRMPPPEWLKNGFKKTRSQIGMDETRPAVQGRVGVGAGVSVDKLFDVWHRAVKDTTQPVVFGGAEVSSYETKASMYGIAATPLQESI